MLAGFTILAYTKKFNTLLNVIFMAVIGLRTIFFGAEQLYLGTMRGEVILLALLFVVYLAFCIRYFLQLTKR